MKKRFVSEALVAARSAPTGSNEPSLPASFLWRDERLEVRTILKTWRGTKTDRGDVYLKRHWFEFETSDGRVATVYFDREARAGKPHWWLYTITSMKER